MALVEADARIDGGIKLHFSSDSNIAISESSESFLNDIDSVIFASAAECGEGEHGDTRLGWKEFFGQKNESARRFREVVRRWGVCRRPCRREGRVRSRGA